MTDKNQIYANNDKPLQLTDDQLTELRAIPPDTLKRILDSARKTRAIPKMTDDTGTVDRLAGLIGINTRQVQRLTEQGILQKTDRG